MVDPAVKTAMGLCVVLAGVCAAMLFRHDPPASPSAASAPVPLLIESDVDATAPGDGRANASTVGRPPATLVKPVDTAKSPPPLAATYPETDRPSNSHRGGSIELLLPATGPRTHKIVDGDTLVALAQRYLGSATRAREIFDANRDVLSDPELLPIGAELKMPPIDGRQSPP